MITIGLECESSEGNSWGIGRTVVGLKNEIENNPELKKSFKFIYYYKNRIPSFSFYYYIWLPIKIFFDRPDIVFFPNYMLPYGIFCKTIVTLTEDLHREMNGKDIPFRYRLAYRIFGTHAARKATKINVYSKTSAKKVSRLFGIDDSRIFVNYLGITPPNPNLNINGDAQLGSYILYVGQMFPRRHAKELILAFREVNKSNPALKLIIVGNDKYNPSVISDLVKGNSNIIWKERVSEDELAGLYANARLFVYVSDSEAFGLPPLEALSYGVLPVVADADISHELFGDNAIFTDSSVGGIGRAITEGMTNFDKRDKIKSGSKSAIERFTWKSHAERFLKQCLELNQSTDRS